MQSRIGVLFALFFLLLALAAARTLYLGVLRGAALRRDAHTQQVIVEEVPAQRGTITDRNGTVLAISEPADEVSADPYLVKNPLEAAVRLAPLLGDTQAALLAKLSERSGFVYLARALPEARAKALLARAQALEIAGLNATATMRRVYPGDTLAAQVLGVIGGEGHGLSGLEYADEALLRGRAGERRVVSAADGEPLSISDVHHEVPGARLALTLDANIQQRTEAVLSAVGSVFHPKDATAIVM
ncbi:MAG TPA: hypothetical protein VNV37_05555, partial [Solirubrobacteraceae bacterium]|nr:hypothetical protein [Solirubrobacteraceae bacterium]